MSGIMLRDPSSEKSCKVDLHNGRIRVSEVLTFFQAVQVQWRDEDGILRILETLSVNETSLSDGTSLSADTFSPGQVLEIAFIPRPFLPIKSSGILLHDPSSGKGCKVDLHNARIRVSEVLTFFQAVQVQWRDEDGILCILDTQSVDDTSLSADTFSPGQVLEIAFIPRPSQIGTEGYKFDYIYVTVGGKTLVRRIRVNKTTLEFEICLRSLLKLIPGAKRVKLVSKDGDYEIELDEDHSKDFVPYISYPGVGAKENPWFLVSVDDECSTRFDFLKHLKHILPSWLNKNYKKLR